MAQNCDPNVYHPLPHCTEGGWGEHTGQDWGPLEDPQGGQSRAQCRHKASSEGPGPRLEGNTLPRDVTAAYIHSHLPHTLSPRSLSVSGFPQLFAPLPLPVPPGKRVNRPARDTPLPSASCRVYAQAQAPAAAAILSKGINEGVPQPNSRAERPDKDAAASGKDRFV